MAQFIALAISVFIALSIANPVINRGATHHVKIYMPRTGQDPAGVSGGGPVGIGPIVIPTPTPGNSGK